MAKKVFSFDEGNASMKNLLGGKGANLAEMTRLGMPIPPGFTITTEACTDYYRSERTLSKEIQEDILRALERLESLCGKKFGDAEDPLLVSVRSGARVSMPGMMDTILNLGLNDKSVEGFARKTGNPIFAFDSYRRFIQMFSDVVMEIPKEIFEQIIDDRKKEKKVKHDIELDEDDMKYLVRQFKQVYRDHMSGEEFPQDPEDQLMKSVKAVFRSWDNERAHIYRRMHDIPGNWGTAVNIQAMVFGNMGSNSGTGVAFTRNPATGEKGIFGEYLINAQGEDVVSGVRTPEPIHRLKEDLPQCYDEFITLALKLERHYRDMQDLEFTIQEGKLYFLQTRNGKRTAKAAVRIATDLMDEGLITAKEAVLRVDPKSLTQLLHPAFDEKALANAKAIGSALPASPGAAAGKIYFTAEDAAKAAESGEPVIMVRLETSPEDIEGMHAACGILTARGGMTSHAAVVARGMGTCCISGCSDLNINEKDKSFTLGERTFREGDYISLDGSDGKIYGEKIPVVPAAIEGDFKRIMNLADRYRRMKVRANADTETDASKAIELGAEGIGLCRTEHMFFEKDRINKMRRMILANTEDERKKALAELLPYQKEDFKKIYRVLLDKPVTVRFLDPPLHEFLPSEPKDIAELAEVMNKTEEEIKDVTESLYEFNPMMGHRGCRLAVSYPEIVKMQTRAIMEAAIETSKEMNVSIVPEMMIPLTGDRNELRFVKEIAVSTAEIVKEEKQSDISYLIGTMIEIPRAALLAGEIAEEAEFFSFGTNDLTQMCFGFSRDDSERFLKDYYSKRIYDFDPFEKLDTKGVGQLIEYTVERGRRTRPDIKIGLCGEQGGDPFSVDFCNNFGLDYVSCSPYRVPVAKLAAAQSEIRKTIK